MEAETPEVEVEEKKAESTKAEVEENEAEPTEAEVEKNEAESEDEVEEKEMTETYGRSAWLPLLSVGSWLTGKATKLLASTALRLACGLKNFERVIAYIPPALNHNSHCDNFMCMQLTGKYTMSR